MPSSPTSKPIPTLTVENDVVHVIDRTALIENVLNQIIVDYCQPRQEAREFMWSVVLDTSVTSLGAKIKVVLAIANELAFTLNRDALHKAISIRNAFAHHASDAFPIVKLTHRPEDLTQYNLLTVLEGSGKIQYLPRHEAYTTFIASYSAAMESLVQLKSLVSEAVEGDA